MVLKQLQGVLVQIVGEEGLGVPLFLLVKGLNEVPSLGSGNGHLIHIISWLEVSSLSVDQNFHHLGEIVEEVQVLVVLALERVHKAHSLLHESSIINIDNFVIQIIELLREDVFFLASGGLDWLGDECVGEPSSVVHSSVHFEPRKVLVVNWLGGEKSSTDGAPTVQLVVLVKSIELLLDLSKAKVVSSLGHSLEGDGVSVDNRHLDNLHVGEEEAKVHVGLIVVKSSHRHGHGPLGNENVGGLSPLLLLEVQSVVRLALVLREGLLDHVNTQDTDFVLIVLGF